MTVVSLPTDFTMKQDILFFNETNNFTDIIVAIFYLSVFISTIIAILWNV